MRTPQDSRGSHALRKRLAHVGVVVRAHHMVWQTTGHTVFHSSAVRGGIALALPPRHGIFPRALPFLPIWPGFAINTIFYAAIVLLLFAAPGRLRRRRRIKRGLCPACAYPVGSSDTCSECGKSVRPATVQPDA